MSKAKDSDSLAKPVYDIKYQRTFCMIKPDGVMRGLIGEIIHRIEKAGLKVVAMKMLLPTEAQIHKHYPVSDEAWVYRLGKKALSGLEAFPDLNPEDVYGTDDKKTLGSDVVDSLVKYFQAGPVVCMVVEGVQAVAMVRKLAGNTLPFKADVGTIRGDFSVDTPAIANTEKRAIHNLVHASETSAEAENEISLWFKGEIIHDYALGNDNIMYSKHY
ncbi:MAG: nucleoside-diphosphate kinase [Candidatus Nomurabacteria bacterium]|jgi:nucleoside-diphosphate kinase|nr:nucleoside-diphosphate kinase [Candidatus Nomurabacteria bacterium]